MCKVNEKTYVYPNGTERLVETVQYCSKSNKKALCNSYERIPMGPFFVHDPEPSLVEDDGFGTPSSGAGQPPTPTSTAGVEHRSPAGLERRPSSKTKRLIDASKLKISFKKDSPKQASHYASASGSSGSSSGHRSHSRHASYDNPSTTSPLAGQFPERVPSGLSPTTNSPNNDRRRRLRAVVDQHLQPSPPPGSSSSLSTLSGHVSPVGQGRSEPRLSETERRMAEALGEQQKRQHRREEKARGTDRQATLRDMTDQELAEHEARETALDEQARREWERGNAREEIRRKKAARRAEEEQRNANPERRYTLPNEEVPTNHQHRRSSTADQTFVDDLRRSMPGTYGTADSPDTAEDQRRRDILQEQLRSGHVAPDSSRSNSDLSDRVSSHRKDSKRAQHEPRHGHGAHDQAYRQHEHTPTSPGHRPPPVAYETRMSSHAAQPGIPETRRRSWHRPDISARNPNVSPGNAPQRRPSITRRPSSSSARHVGATYAEPARPSSSSSRNNSAWTQDDEAFRRRGEEVLARARARGTVMDRAQETSFRMGDVMYDDDDDFAPEEYYRRGR